MNSIILSPQPLLLPDSVRSSTMRSLERMERIAVVTGAASTTLGCVYLSIEQATQQAILQAQALRTVSGVKGSLTPEQDKEYEKIRKELFATMAALAAQAGVEVRQVVAKTFQDEEQGKFGRFLDQLLG